MAISVVHTTAANSLTVTIPATTAGNCLVVCVASLNATTPASISGITLGGSADNFAQAVANTAQTASAFIWADPNCAGGQTSVVISGAHLTVSAGNGGVVVYEVSGLAASSPVDKTSSGNAASGTTWSSGTTAATTQAAEFWAGVADAFNPVGPGAPWNNTTAGTSCIAGQQITSATGTATYNGTCTNTGPVAAAVATFKPASLPGTATPAEPMPTPRRRPRRAVASFPVVATTNAAPAAPVPGTLEAPIAPRRRPRRAVASFPVVATVNAPARAAGILPPVTTPRRRRARRAWVRFTPVATTNALPPPKTLLISLASAAGTDDYGTPFPQGIFATAGVIEGPEFIGPDYIINSSGFFFYNGTPAAGNLVASNATADGADSFGNNYVAGWATYTGSLATALAAGTVITYSGSLFFGWNPGAIIETNTFGDLILAAASGRQVITANNILDGGGGGATFQADVSVNGVNLNVGNGSNAKVNLNPPMATPSNTAAVKAGTATLAQTESCLGDLIQSLQNRGLVN